MVHIYNILEWIHISKLRLLVNLIKVHLSPHSLVHGNIIISRFCCTETHPCNMHLLYYAASMYNLAVSCIHPQPLLHGLVYRFSALCYLFLALNHNVDVFIEHYFRLCITNILYWTIISMYFIEDYFHLCVSSFLYWTIISKHFWCAVINCVWLVLYWSITSTCLSSTIFTYVITSLLQWVVSMYYLAVNLY